MGRYEIIPNTTRFECSGSAAYGMVRVRDTEDPAHPELDVRVDTNWADGTAHPRLILPNGTSVDFDDTFLSAYQALQRGTATPAQETACRELGASASPVAPAATPPVSSPISPFWVVVPTLAVVAQYGLDRAARHDLSRIPAPDGFGTMGTATNLLYMGSELLFTSTYIPIHRRLGSTAGWITDGVCMGGGLGFTVAGLAQRSGMGTPELATGLTLGTTCISSMIYGNDETSRDPVRFWSGFASQLVWGGLGLGLGLGGVGRRDLPTGGGIYAPPDAVPGSHDDLNPYRMTQFPNLNNDFTSLGIANVAGAAVNLFDYLVFSGPRAPVPNSTARRLSVNPTPGGAMFNVSGSF